MIQLSTNTRRLQPSKIRSMFNKALEYGQVVNLTLGEPDFTASENVVQAGCQAIQAGQTKYSANAGLLPLRQSISQYLNRTDDLKYDPVSQIIVTPGAMGALYLALKAILNPGDEVVVSEPCWTNYLQQIQMCAGIPVPVQTDPRRGFDLDVQAIRAAVSSRTKAIILNSPCNPTGAVASREALEALAQVAETFDLAVLADEVYKHILFDGAEYTSFASLPGMAQRTLVINSLSKTYAMTGWRVGFAAGPAEVIEQMTKLQENTSACASTPCQYAAIEALNGPQTYLEYMREQYRIRRDYVLERVASIPGLSCSRPQGTFYAFLDIRQSRLNSETFAMKLLEEERVVLVPGTAFGSFGEGYIRLSYASSMESLAQGFDRIAAFMERCHG